MTDRPRVSVVAPHYEDLTRLGLLLEALDSQYPIAGGFEIIVADNGSPAGAAAVESVLAGRARLTVISEKGAGAARNGGVAQARGDILAFTDADCIPEPKWLSEGLAALKAVDIVGGRVKVFAEDPAAMTPVEAFECLFAFRNEAYVREQAFTVTANLFCSRKVFDAVGPFDITGVSEDLEWCRRARRLGYRLGFSRNTVVAHPARRTWEDLTIKWRRIDREMFKLATSRSGGRLHWVRRTMLLPFSPFFHTPAALFRRGVSTFPQRRSAIRVLFRIRFWRFFDSLRLIAK